MLGHVTSGVLTRSVRDAGRILEVLAGSEPGDPCLAPKLEETSADTVIKGRSRLRIGFVSDSGEPRWSTDPACVRAVETAAALLQEVGHEVDVSHPPALFEEEFGPSGLMP